MHLCTEKIFDCAVKQVRLIKIRNMSGAGKHNETRAGQLRLHLLHRRGCGPVLIACEKQYRSGHRAHGGAKVVVTECSSATDKAVDWRCQNHLADFRKMTAETSRGCILLENPQKLVQFLEQHQAVDTTSRGTALEELKKMTPRAGHHMVGEEIPEKNVFYKLAKKKYFFGFGAYG